MKAPDESFAEVRTLLRVGNEEAAAQVFHRFASRLVALAGSRLDRWLRAKVDPEDVVQSVYRSFFTRYTAGEFQLASWNDLWALLTVITLRKCVNRVEYLRAQCRDAGCEVALEPAAGDSGRGWEAIDPEPTPEEAALLTEAVEQMLRGFDPDDRAVVELNLQGHTVEEIARRLGRAERTVWRLRGRVKQRLQRMLKDNG